MTNYTTRSRRVFSINDGKKSMEKLQILSIEIHLKIFSLSESQVQTEKPPLVIYYTKC